MSTSAATPHPAARRGTRPQASRHEAPVPSITDAAESLEDDQARRMRRYLIQMSMRVVFFIAAYFVSGWLRWTFVAFAVVIPYVAVLLVNAGRDRVTYETSAVLPAPLHELTELPESARIVVDPDLADPKPAHTEPADDGDAVGPDHQEK